ncbi:MAG: tetratricopeptide repeat protein [Paludibacterium sp.]|uniref:YfgM family protein n=1 Tax=Paludibacterium sp. TaxID=1917523 RepID=UPI0025EAC6A7|nr:tetratricopeptide repeat protein [Paludibacterium sp.]MBV8046252.1 tetratricopeptide repeat protein [Paludibacterium sp.]MBV8649769.1 tetratricopeptide repeat protein [Paludibacterium sp.]
MAFDLQEQEQIDSLKVFWNQWGKWVVAGVGCLAIGYLGYKAYNLYQARQVEASAAVYVSLEQAAGAQDLAKVKAGAASIEADYATSPFAPRAAFLAAKAGFDKNDLAYARDQLNWVATHAKEPALVSLAQLRLANVLLDQKQYDAAVAQLNLAHEPAFDALYFDAKGDVFAIKGDKSAARDAYQAALAKLASDAPSREYIQTKLDALGG